MALKWHMLEIKVDQLESEIGIRSELLMYIETSRQLIWLIFSNPTLPLQFHNPLYNYSYIIHATEAPFFFLNQTVVFSGL